MNVDGGARGNPGPAAIGVLVRTMGGEVLAEAAETIGVATNNVAEYRALLRGIELVVKQVRGEYRVKDPGLKPLHAEVRTALAGLGQWTFDHVRRENNAHADDLVNQALDAAS